MKMAKLEFEKSRLNFSSLELEFNSAVNIKILIIFLASLHWHCYFIKNRPFLVGFRCYKCVFALLNI